MLNYIKIWENYEPMNEYLRKDLKEYPGKINPEIEKLDGDINKISDFIKELLKDDIIRGYKAYKDLISTHPEFMVTKDLIMKKKEKEVFPIIDLASTVRNAVKSFDGIY